MRRKNMEEKGYVFEHFRLGHFIYHYTNIVVGTNLQLQTMSRKKSLKVWYFLPYFEYEKLMETIIL